MAAHGGMFSFMTSLFTSRVAISTEISEFNSQNIPLLRAAQNYDPNPSKGGGDIIVVDGTALLSETGPSGSLANIEDQPVSDQISIYVVREGDSLSQIADMFGVSTNTIIWANDIKRGSLIQSGQTLVILPVTGVRYAVKKGDTLRSITKAYKGDLDEIVAYNDIDADASLTVGQIVIIPDGEIAAPKYTGSTSLVRGTSGPEYSGYYIHPLPGGTKTQRLHGYNAVDVGAPIGTSIIASAAGTVIISKSSGWNGGYGSYIVIRHNNGTQTLYSHMSRNIAYPGQNVVQGQVIGYVGVSGRVTGPHLHFEIRGAYNPF